MMQTSWTVHSTTRANKLVSDFREAGIPSGVAISYDPTDVDEASWQRHLAEHKYRASGHPQTAVWTPRYGFVIFDYFFCFKGTRGFKGQADPPYHGLFIPIIVPDLKDANWELWFNSDDPRDPATQRGHPQPDWLYYSENLRAPPELLPYLQPADW